VVFVEESWSENEMYFIIEITSVKLYLSSFNSNKNEDKIMCYIYNMPA
jgi:NADPH-dependent 7-cyano-7-deazaguanine reductase QueF-like protein